MATRADIRAYARIRSDQDDSTFPDDDQYNTLINFAARAVWHDMLHAGWRPQQSKQTITANGAQSYDVFASAPGTVAAFAEGVYRVEGLETNARHVRELKRIPEEMIAAARNQTSDEAIYYRVSEGDDGMQLELFPTPVGGYYRVYYIHEQGDMSNDSDVWVGPRRSDELIGLKVAIQAMRKEGNDQGANLLQREYDELRAQLVAAVNYYDARNPQTIRDVQAFPAMKDPFDYDV